MRQLIHKINFCKFSSKIRGCPSSGPWIFYSQTVAPNWFWTTRFSSLSPHTRVTAQNIGAVSQNDAVIRITVLKCEVQTRPQKVWMIFRESEVTRWTSDIFNMPFSVYPDVGRLMLLVYKAMCIWTNILLWLWNFSLVSKSIHLYFFSLINYPCYYNFYNHYVILFLS